MESVQFVVDETPYACWDWDLSGKNREFLEGLDADYFRYAAETNTTNLDGEDKHWAALSLRVTYSQGLETLFALLCALVQAPQCVVGWVLAYQNRELERLVYKISRRQPVYSRLTVQPSWRNLAELVYCDVVCEPEKKRWMQEGFGKLWERFAGEFTDAKISQEYNSAKHGLRTRVGGFSLHVGPEVIPGVPPPSEKDWKLVGGSDFGTSYFTLERLGGDGRLNFRPRLQSRNWNPENLTNSLLLLSMSINNVISFLRVTNGVPREKCPVRVPDSEKDFDAPWKTSVGITDMDMDTIILADDIKPCTKEEVLRSYAPSKAEEPSEE